MWGPIVTAAADRLAAVLSTGTTGELELRLRQAGLSDVTVAGYRRRQLAYTVAGSGVRGGAGVAAARLDGAVAGRDRPVHLDRHVPLAGQGRRG